MDRQVYAVGPFKDIIPDAVRVGDVVHLSGAVSVGADGVPMHEGDFLAQNQQAYRNIGDALAGVGATFAHVVKETVFVTDMMGPVGDPENPFAAYAAMRDAIYDGKGAEVAQSLVQVAGLVMPQLLVEIEVVAHL